MPRGFQTSEYFPLLCPQHKIGANAYSIIIIVIFTLTVRTISTNHRNILIHTFIAT